MTIALLCATAQAFAQAVMPLEPQRASFTTTDGTALTAWVFMPNAQQRPLATVVALHGCGGLYASVGERKGKLNARHQAMAEFLTGLGYVAVFPDSLTPRGETELCTQRIGTRKVDQTQRRIDALASLVWTSGQAWADPKRIAVLGWSHGGSAVLAATDASHSLVQQTPQTFAAAVAFYPGCAASLRRNHQPNAPLVLMLGALDDWTPPGPCIELGKAVGAEVNVFEGSYHDFDNPQGRVRIRADVPNGVNPGQGVHVGPNPAARTQAYERLRQVLAERLR